MKIKPSSALLSFALFLSLDIFSAYEVLAGPLMPQERRGKLIYTKGIISSDKEIKALVGDASLEVSASTIPCAGCHGHNGQGRPEGGITPSNISWEYLTKSDSITHPNGRSHPGYTEATIERAILEGIDPAGNRLAVTMPRYLLSKGDIADLLSYIKRLGKDQDPGLTETSIRIGTILPLSGSLTEMGMEMKGVMEAYFEDINNQGGIYGRRVELRVSGTSENVSGTLVDARHLVRDEGVFALVGSFTTGADKEIAELVDEEGIPLVGSYTFFPQDGHPLNRYIFYLFSGLKDQSRLLVDFASQKFKIRDPRIAIVYPESQIFLAITGAIERQARKYGWNSIARISYPKGRFEAGEIAGRLQGGGADFIFFFGSGGEGISLWKESEKFNWTSLFFLSGPLAGKEVIDAPLSFKDKIFLTYPTLPSDLTREGVIEYRSFLERHRLLTRHPAAQISAYCAAKILAEGLKIAGKDLSREKLVDVLEGFYDFETGLTPGITYGPNRRIGALGAYIVALDLEKKRFIPASGWLTPD